MTEQIRKAVKSGKVGCRKHVLSRLIERGIDRREILDVILTGEVIEKYPDDRPYQSRLFYAMINEKPLHVVVSYDEVNDIVYIITAYEPLLAFFESDFKTRIIK